MSNTCSRTDRRALERDETVLAAHLLRSLSRILVDVLTRRLVDPARPIDLGGLHDQVADVLDTSMRRQVQLQDRWARRRKPPRESRPLPMSARPFRHRGTYLGTFSSLKAVAARVLKDRTPPTPDLYDAGIDLHIHGLVWTIDADGMLHAFASEAPVNNTVKSPIRNE